jgi:hypothetical protein
MHNVRNVCTVSVGEFRVEDHLKHLGLDGSIILKRTLSFLGGRILDLVGLGYVLAKTRFKPFCCIKFGDLPEYLKCYPRSQSRPKKEIKSY